MDWRLVWGREWKQKDWGHAGFLEGSLDSHCSIENRDKWRNLQDIQEEYTKDLSADLCGVGVRKKSEIKDDSHISSWKSQWAEVPFAFIIYKPDD